MRWIIPHVNDTFTEKSLSAAGSTVFLEQFVWVTPSMDSRTWCEKFVAFFCLLPSIVLWHVLSFWWKDDPDIMDDEEAAGTRCPAMEIEPEKFRPRYKVHTILRVRSRN